MTRPGASHAFDAIVIGGGHNGLVCAGYLARAGLRTVVLERRSIAGGALETAEILPGARVPVLAHTVGRLRGSISRDLGLREAGLRLVQPAARAVSVRPDGPPITTWGDPGRTAAELVRISARDAVAWPETDREVRALAGLLDRLMRSIPPDLSHPDLGDAISGLRLGLRFGGLRTADARTLLRALPMPIADYLEDRFETDALRALVATRGTRYTALGPRSAGTTQVMLADAAGTGSGLAGETVYARGGPGALAQALVAAVERFGGEVRTSSEVVAIRRRGGRAIGVALADGTEIDARIVVGGVDPKRLLLGLLGRDALDAADPDLAGEVAGLRMGGVTAKVNLALSDLPRFAGLEGEEGRLRLRGRIIVAPSVAYLDHAADAAKYGRVSDAPWLEATIPSLVDPLLVDGARSAGVRHVMSIVLQSAPYRLRDGTWDAGRDALRDLAIRTLDAVASGIGDLVLAAQVVTPLDMDAEYGLTGGGAMHGEPSLDQWFAWRPLVGLARHRMPLAGTYLCGSGAHPGGGITGLPGRNAARAVLEDVR